MTSAKLAAEIASYLKGDIRWSAKDSRVIRRYVDKLLLVGRLFTRKHHDYGTENVAASGELGQFFRARDRVARLSKAARGRKMKNESIEDSWQDLANHALMALMLRAGEWPDVEDGWEIGRTRRKS